MVKKKDKKDIVSKTEKAIKNKIKNQRKY